MAAICSNYRLVTHCLSTMMTERNPKTEKVKNVFNIKNIHT